MEHEELKMAHGGCGCGGKGHGHGQGRPGGHPGGHPGAHPGGHRQLTAPEVSGDPRDVAVDPAEVNNRENYSLHSVFAVIMPLPEDDVMVKDMVFEVEKAVAACGVQVRGWYDVAGYRPDADLMLWFTAIDTEKGVCQDRLQDAYRAVAGSRLGRHLEPVFSLMEAHMTAEFNAPHLPACFGGWAPRQYCAFYPFIRSLDWYYLPKARRGAMLKEHGMNGRDYNDVAVSTLAAFALGDYEWTVSLEADDLARVMGVLRQQRDCEARLFVKEDTPFFTGKRMELEEWALRQNRAL